MKNYKVYMNTQSKRFAPADWAFIGWVKAKKTTEAKRLLKGVVYGKFESDLVDLETETINHNGGLGTLKFEAQ